MVLCVALPEESRVYGRSPVLLVDSGPFAKASYQRRVIYTYVITYNYKFIDKESNLIKN